MLARSLLGSDAVVAADAQSALLVGVRAENHQGASELGMASHVQQVLEKSAALVGNESFG